MLIVEMSWGRPNVTTVYGLHDGELLAERSIPDPHPDPNFRSLDCQDAVWEAAFHLAVEHGWKPQGAIFEKTVLNQPRAPGQVVTYADYEPHLWDEAKLVTAEDANGWADGLATAFAAISAGQTSLPSIKPSNIITNSATPYVVYGSLDANFLEEFIRFLRKGPFHYAYDD